MIDTLMLLIIDESKWLTASLSLAVLLSIVIFAWHRPADQNWRRRITPIINLFFSVTIGTMAFGHLLAVTVKNHLGTLDGSLLLLYLLGAILFLPAVTLGRYSLKLLREKVPSRTLIALNTTLAVALLAMGLHNFPLALPGFLNIGYQIHKRRSIGWALLGICAVVNIGLFIGSLVFLASGQSFEQFQGID